MNAAAAISTGLPLGAGRALRGGRIAASIRGLDCLLGGLECTIGAGVQPRGCVAGVSLRCRLEGFAGTRTNL